MILVSLDTLRQDHLGCYGYPRDTSPHIDRLVREEAVLFDSAYAQAPFTLPSHMSMLTGLYPEAHGILQPVVQDGTNRVACLADGVNTLAETLQSNGFKTVAFTDGVLVDKKYGFDQGFDRYEDENIPDHEKNGFRKYGKELHAWIRENCQNDFFLFIHTYDTHAPYVPPEPYRSRFKGKPPAKELPRISMPYCELIGYHEGYKLHTYGSIQDLVDRYDGGVAYVDHELGQLFNLLKELSLWENALVVITSDHGESFRENAPVIGHGLSLNNEEILIPLIIKLPVSLHAGRRVAQTVESVDIMPTLLAVLEIPGPLEVQGQNLLEGLNKGRWRKDFAYGTSPNTENIHYFIQDGIKFIEGIHDPNFKFIRNVAKPMTPPTAAKPQKPYLTIKHINKDYFYNFDRDPLGMMEFVIRGDRAYDLRTSKFEWMAQEVHDEDLLKRYKKTANLIADRSSELGRRFFRSNKESVTLSLKDIEQLHALGYGGLAASEDSPDGTISERAYSKEEIRITPPLIDRTLLSRGDEVLWEVRRYVAGERSGFEPGELEERIDQARSDYEAFKARYPDKANWADWRLKMLDLLPGIVERRKATK